MRALLVIALTMIAGCGHYGERGTLPPLMVHVRGGATDEAFDRLVHVARELGYPIDFLDRRYGVFGVRTRESLRGNEGPATLVVQCYADGRATVSLLGAAPVDRTPRVRVPDSVRREAVALAQALEAGRAP